MKTSKVTAKGGIYMVESAVPARLLANARYLRRNQTPAEKMLWRLIRNRKLNNLKFRRQHPMSKGFVLDFFCPSHKLGIELDGGIHKKTEIMEYDKVRTKAIEMYGIRIIRFTNEEVIKTTEIVLKRIIRECNSSANDLRNSGALSE